MKLKRDLILVGGGGHCAAVADVIERTESFRILGIVDRTEPDAEQGNGYPWLGDDRELPMLVRSGAQFHVAIGHIRTCEPRRRIFELLRSLDAELPAIVCPTAIVSPTATVGAGSIIMARAVLSARVTIGVNAIVNTGAIVEHHSTIGSHTHVSTSATINGRSTVGERCFVGSHATIREGVIIGDESLVGAASYVNRSVHSGDVVYGVPARSHQSKPHLQTQRIS